MVQHEGPTTRGDSGKDAQMSYTRTSIIFGLAGAVMIAASGSLTYGSFAGRDVPAGVPVEIITVCAIPGWLYTLAAWRTARRWRGPSTTLGVLGILASIAGALLSAAGFLLVAALSGCHDLACPLGSVVTVTTTVIPFFLSLVGIALGTMGVSDARRLQ